MKIEDISVVMGHARPVTAEAVSEAEAALGVTFPTGYREYVTTLGSGVLGGSYVRVYLPGDIVRNLGEFRQRWDELWLGLGLNVRRFGVIILQNRVANSPTSVKSVDSPQFMTEKLPHE